ncbi:MAG TPA: CopD family protein [Steroidobacteraceae bacterium]|jgi:putative copper export protein
MLEAFTALLKFALYAGVLSGSGAVFAQATQDPLPDEAGYLARVTRFGSALVVGACPLITLVLILRLGGEFDDVTMSAVFASGSGAALFLQTAGALLLLTTASDEASMLVRLSYAVLPVLGFAFSGHAAAVGPVDGFVAVLHVSAAAWWLGSLLYLHERCRHADPGRLGNIVARFSSIAFIITGGLVIAGLTLVIILVDFSTDPWLLPYGQILGAKLCVVAALLALAGYNRQRLTPRLLSGDRTAVTTLQRTIVVEMVLIAAVLAITAILTTFTSPHE